MIKLIKNELIKIFKRKTIYFLLILSMIAVIIYNYINPDQNIPISEGTNDRQLISDTQIEKQKDVAGKNQGYSSNGFMASRTGHDQG